MISIRERIRKKDISSGILLFEETASLLFPFFVAFSKGNESSKSGERSSFRSFICPVKKKKKKKKEKERG